MHDLENVGAQISRCRDEIQRVVVVLVEFKGGTWICLLGDHETFRQPDNAVLEDLEALLERPHLLVLEPRHHLLLVVDLTHDIVVEGGWPLAELPHVVHGEKALNVLLENLLKDLARVLVCAHGRFDLVERLGFFCEGSEFLGVFGGGVVLKIVLGVAKELAKEVALGPHDAVDRRTRRAADGADRKRGRGGLGLAVKALGLVFADHVRLPEVSCRARLNERYVRRQTHLVDMTPRLCAIV